jgi:hypothetical protein
MSGRLINPKRTLRLELRTVLVKIDVALKWDALKGSPKGRLQCG